MVVIESTFHSLPLPLPLPLPSLLPNGIVTAKEWFKYLQAPSEYVTTTADCDKEILFSSNNIINEDPFEGKDSSRTSLASTSTSTSTSTTTLASITHESMNRDLISSKNSALVKTTEAELKMVIGTETESTNTDIVKSEDNRNRVMLINQYDKNGNSYQGGGHEDVGGDEEGGKAGVEDEEEGEEGGEGGGAGGGGIKSTNGFFPTHMGMGRDVGRGMGSSSSSSHNAYASAKPFLSDINKKSCELLLMKQIHAIGENQINSENTYYVHEKSAFSVVSENFADRKVSDSVMPAMPCYAMLYHAMQRHDEPCETLLKYRYCTLHYPCRPLFNLL